jgi:hypothetical protein
MASNKGGIGHTQVCSLFKYNQLKSFLISQFSRKQTVLRLHKTVCYPCFAGKGNVLRFQDGSTPAYVALAQICEEALKNSQYRTVHGPDASIFFGCQPCPSLSLQSSLESLLIRANIQARSSAISRGSCVCVPAESGAAWILGNDPELVQLPTAFAQDEGDSRAPP